MTAVTDPLGHITAILYDTVGRVSSRTDTNGNSTSYMYDGLGRGSSQTDANGGVTSFTYDGRGNLTSLTDPNGNTTLFEYDLAGRKTKETRPEGQATIYSYYPNGLLQTVKDAKGQLTTYIYDKGNRLTETDFADGTRHTFSYDAVGNMTGYGSPAGSGTLVYDAVNRKTSETVNFGSFSKTHSYSYDGRGNKASFTTPEGAVYNYTFNKNNQPIQITTPVGAITLAYQWIRQTKLTYPNGIVTDYGYNDADWLNLIKVNNAKVTPSVPLTNASYAFDNVGNITGKTTQAGVHSYGYDKLYQLTQATIPTQSREAYTYDTVGNRLTSASTQENWSYNKNNELQGYNGISFGYDANGNTVTKTDNGSATSYGFNAQDRLETVVLPNGVTATYRYDPFGRRLRKQVGTDTTFFLYADEGLVGEFDASGSFNKGYGWRPGGIWGPNPVFMVEDDEYSFYHNDHLGTPEKMTDIDGEVVWNATYGAFGDASVDSASTVTNYLRFPGQYFDVESGLQYNRYRYYDPVSGRYIEKDPVGFSAGDTNLFRYVINNSESWKDPYGLVNSELLVKGTTDLVEVGITVGSTLIIIGASGGYLLPLAVPATTITAYKISTGVINIANGLLQDKKIEFTDPSLTWLISMLLTRGCKEKADKIDKAVEIMLWALMAGKMPSSQFLDGLKTAIDGAKAFKDFVDQFNGTNNNLISNKNPYPAFKGGSVWKYLDTIK